MKLSAPKRRVGTVLSGVAIGLLIASALLAIWIQVFGEYPPTVLLVATGGVGGGAGSFAMSRLIRRFHSEEQDDSES